MRRIIWLAEYRMWGCQVDGVGSPIAMHVNKSVLEDWLDQLDARNKEAVDASTEKNEAEASDR